MSVNGPNEWSGPRARLAARIRQPVDLRGVDENDRDRLTRSHAAMSHALDDAATAVEAVRAERGMVGDPRADAQLRTHLALALAARALEAGAFTARRQVAECRDAADEILDLRPDRELEAFAEDLRDRVRRAERWRWVPPTSVLGFAVVLLAVLVLPFVGSAVGDRTVTVVGVLVGSALVFGSVIAHRKQQWEVDRE